MADQLAIVVDLGYFGNVLDQHVNSHVVNMRRDGPDIRFAVTPGPVITLSPDQADTIGRSLIAAAALARTP